MYLCQVLAGWGVIPAFSAPTVTAVELDRSLNRFTSTTPPPPPKVGKRKCPIEENKIGCLPFFVLKAETAGCGFREPKDDNGVPVLPQCREKTHADAHADADDINRCVAGCTMYHRQFYGFVEKAIRTAVAKYRFERGKELMGLS